MPQRVAKGSAPPTNSATTASRNASPAKRPQSATTTNASPSPAAKRTTSATPAASTTTTTAPKPAANAASPVKAAPAKAVVKPPAKPSDQSVRDRIVALYAKYNASFIPRVDILMKRFAGDKTASDQFIAEYVKQHGPEPPSKEVALREYFTKTYRGDSESIESAMKLIREVPGIEVQIFTELMMEEEKKKKAAAAGAAGTTTTPANRSSSPTATSNAKAPATVPKTGATTNTTTAAAATPAAKTAPGTKQIPGSPTAAATGNAKLPQQQPSANNTSAASPTSQQSKTGAAAATTTAKETAELRSSSPPSSSSPLQKSAATPNNNNSNDRSYSTTSFQEVEIQTTMKPKSTCDKLIRDRVVAMLASYDPDSLLMFDEDSDIPTTEVGTCFLQALTEQHGPEPVSKRSAFETLLRRLLLKQDPARMKSIGTLMAAAEATGREVHIVRSLFTAYGLESRPGRSVASSGLASTSSVTNISNNFGMFSPSLSAANAANTSTTSIMSSFHAGGVGFATSWSPDASITAQKSLFDSSPRRLPLRTKEDLLYQLSGTPKVHKPHPNARGSDFSDLLTLDTQYGPEPLFGDDDKRREQYFGGNSNNNNNNSGNSNNINAMDFQLSDLEPFRKTAAGVTHTVDNDDDDNGEMPANHVNPFMRPGGKNQLSQHKNQSQQQQQPTRPVVPDFPRTPPNVDLGNFGSL